MGNFEKSSVQQQFAGLDFSPANAKFAQNSKFVGNFDTFLRTFREKFRKKLVPDLKPYRIRDFSEILENLEFIAFLTCRTPQTHEDFQKKKNGKEFFFLNL